MSPPPFATRAVEICARGRRAVPDSRSGHRPTLVPDARAGQPLRRERAAMSEPYRPRPVVRLAWPPSTVAAPMPPAALMTLLIALLLGVGPRGGGLPRRDRRAERGDVQHPAWQDLRLKRVRYLVPWDWARTGQAAEVAAFMTAARAHGQDVLVTFTAHRGCFVGRRYSRSRACRAPSASAFRAAFRGSTTGYPWVRTYSAWNEVNHISQPTFGQPAPRRALLPRAAPREPPPPVPRHGGRRAGHRRTCAATCGRSCAGRPGSPRLWGLHNYQDVNDRTSADTRTHAPDRAGRGLADGDQRRS